MAKPNTIYIVFKDDLIEIIFYDEDTAIEYVEKYGGQYEDYHVEDWRV